MKKNTFQNVKHAAGLLLPYIRPFKWGFLLAGLMVVFQNICLAVSPVVEGSITTQLASDAADLLNGVPGAMVHMDVVTRTILLVILIYLVKAVTQSLAIQFLTNATQKSMNSLRTAAQKKIHTLPVQYFDTHSYGDVLSRVTNDIENISNAIQQTVVNIVSGVLSLALALVMMFRINVWMALIVLLIIPSALLITRVVVRHSQRYFKQQQDAVGELNGKATELYTGYHEILLYNKQRSAVEEFCAVNDRLRQNAFRAQFMSSLMSPLISFVTYLVIAAVAVAGCLFAIAGTLAIGNLQAFIRYIWQVNDPLSQVSQLSTQIQSACASAARLAEFLAADDMEPDADPAERPERTAGHVTFDHVAFGYGKQPVIRDLNLNVKPGQMAAIVGPTGAGKTTIINLLLRFYDVNSGAIRIDGVDIRQMKREELRRLFGLVLQDTWLFLDTILENLRYGNHAARRDEVVEAAKAANVHHFISTLPDGYDMEVNEEGSNISQGEKQLLTIARALLRDPQILILDEATSSVDTRLEKRLQDAMHNIMKGRTSFVIAHRLSTIRSADVILVLDGGEIVEQGTHEELMAKRGYYEKLYNAQFAE